MNELAPTKEVKPIGATSKDSAALRGLCASMNSGFLAPGGADERTQKEITEAMKSAGSFKQPTPTSRVDTPAPVSEEHPPANDAPRHRDESEATAIPTSLPTSEERAKTLVHKDVPEIPIVTGSTEETDCEVPVAAVPEPEETPGNIGASTDGTINPKYRKVVFTGQMKAGKDHCAAAAGYRILSLAEPLYALLNFFFGITEEQKDLPGARAFMQKVGTWGRGDVDAHEPLTPERAVFTRMIYAMAKALPEQEYVEWESFGKNKDIWLDACITKANAILSNNPLTKVAVVNGRFENEVKAFDADGWTRFHVMASPLALKQRREQAGVPPAALAHSSEKMAVGLDKGSLALAGKTSKPKINVIWNDPKAGRPSSKFYHLGEFVSTVNQPV